MAAAVRDTEIILEPSRLPRVGKRGSFATNRKEVFDEIKTYGDSHIGC